MTTKYRPKENSTDWRRPFGRGASMREWDSRRSISCHADSHCSSATKRSGKEKPGPRGSYTPERAVRMMYWISCEFTMRSFSWRHAPRHAKMSLGQRLEMISIRSSFESEKMGGMDIAEGDEGRVVSSGGGRLS